MTLACQKVFTTLLVLLLIYSVVRGQTHWVGTWSCAPYAAGESNTPPEPYLAHNTLRQIVRVSIGGDSIRLKLSNKTCNSPVSMQHVTIAASVGDSDIDTTTLSTLTFSGHRSTVLPVNGEMTSDPMAFDLEDDMRVAITIHYGQVSSSADITSHVASRTDSYLVSGDQTLSKEYEDPVITAHWFHINSIEVKAPVGAGSVAVIGNSITDGYGLSGGLQNRWPDILSQELLQDQQTRHIAMLNLGIGATQLTGEEPTAGVRRFEDDVLDQAGLKWIIVYHGVNDIAAGIRADEIIEAYQLLIGKAHKKGLKIYGATITPFKGHSYYTPANERTRQEVNAWLRDAGGFDACIDFDKAIRARDDHERLDPRYSNDGLHPNVAGYALLGKSVDRRLFIQ